MFISKKFLALLLVVGTAFTLSGCATCCTDKPAASKSGVIRGSIGVPDCEKSTSPLHIDKEAPSQVVVGRPYSYTITVKNASKCALEDVVVTERVPEKYELKTATPTPTKVTGRVAQWDIGYLKPGEVRTITITGVALDASSTTACTKATYNPVLCLGPEAISPALKVALEAPSQALLCDVIPAKIIVSNTGTGSAEGVSITQALPDGLTTTDGKNTVTINVGDLAGGASKNYAVNLKASQAAKYSNKVSAVSKNGLSASSSVVVTDVKQPSLKVAVSGPSKIFSNKNADFKVNVQNVGSADAANAVVQTTIPAGFKFVSADQGGVASGNAVVWNIGTLAAGKSAALNTTFKAVSAGAGQSVATAKGTCCSEASAVTNSEIKGIPAVLLEVVDSDDPIEVGDAVTYYITVTNQGSADDTNIVIKSALEDEFDYVSSSGPTKAKVESAKAVEFAALAVLRPGEKATWAVVAKAVAEGDHRFATKLTSDALRTSVDETESTHTY